MPLYITATAEGSWFRFTHNGQTCYVHSSRTQTSSPPITGYASIEMNVRSAPNGAVIGRISRGEKVVGTLEGNWARYTYNGTTGYVYAALLQKEPIQQNLYIKGQTNIRTSPTGTVVEFLELPLYITATAEGSWFRFTHNGQTCYVHSSRTQTSSPPITGYASIEMNVRSAPNGAVIGRISRGEKVVGTLEGNWARYTYNGTTGYVYAALLQKESLGFFTTSDGSVYANPGETVTLQHKGLANQRHFISVISPRGNKLTAQGLVPKYSDSSGIVTWTWLVGTNTYPGEGKIIINDPNGNIITTMKYVVK